MHVSSAVSNTFLNTLIFRVEVADGIVCECFGAFKCGFSADVRDGGLFLWSAIVLCRALQLRVLNTESALSDNGNVVCLKKKKRLLTLLFSH